LKNKLKSAATLISELPLITPLVTLIFARVEQRPNWFQAQGTADPTNNFLYSIGVNTHINLMIKVAALHHFPVVQSR